MSAKEAELFLAFVRNSKNYVEFGSGGSTCMATKYVRNSVISVDSSREWHDKVLTACESSAIKPQLSYVDIGPTGDWGYPTDQNTKHMWPAYHENIWNIEGSRNGDLYMIDGRFRVACFAQAVINCKKSALICFHDFASRKQYHCVYEIAREVATVEDLSIFQPLTGIDELANNILQQYRFIPS